MKPLDVLEVVNAGATVFRRNLVPLLTLALLAYLPNIPIQMIVAKQTQDAQARGDPFGSFAGFMLSTAIAWLIQLTWSSVLLIAVYRAVADYLDGRPTDLAASISFAFTRLVPVVFTKILIGFLLFAVLAAGLVVIGIFFVIWFLIGWALVNPVMASENLFYFSALRRSWKLMFGYRPEPGGTPTYLRYIFLYLIYFLISVVLGMVAMAPQYIFMMRTMFQRDLSQMMNPPMALTLTSAVLQTAIFSLVTGFFACAVYIFYTDLKVRFEPSVPAEPVTPESPSPTTGPVPPPSF
jgi:hypothetical protein